MGSIEIQVRNIVEHFVTVTEPPTNETLGIPINAIKSLYGYPHICTSGNYRTSKGTRFSHAMVTPPNVFLTNYIIMSSEPLLSAWCRVGMFPYWFPPSWGSSRVTASASTADSLLRERRGPYLSLDTLFFFSDNEVPTRAGNFLCSPSPKLFLRSSLHEETNAPVLHCLHETWW